MKLKNILMVGVLMLTACHNDDEVIVNEPVTGPTEAKIMSFNILYDDPEENLGTHSWRARRGAILKMIDQERPEVLCLQEPMWNQVLYLDDKLAEYDYVDQNVNGNDNADGLHNAIFYRNDKYTLIDNGAYWLSSQPNGLSYPWNTADRQRRVTVWAHLKDNQTKAHFYVCSTHLNLGSEDVDLEARKRSAQLNVDKMKELAGQDTTVVICGDMNASYAVSDPKRDGLAPYYEWMVSARDEAADTDTKFSFNQFEASMANECWNLDHIFVRKATPLKFRTLDGDYGVDYISDHYPIISTIKF